jgi:hypothetical protein
MTDKQIISFVSMSICGNIHSYSCKIETIQQIFKCLKILEIYIYIITWWLLKLFDADFCMWVFQVLRMAGQIEAWKSLEKR